jgi:hypothetical protein
MEPQDQLRLELMRARTELAFLLSDQVRAQAEEIRSMRRHVSQLLEAVNEKSETRLECERARASSFAFYRKQQTGV